MQPVFILISEYMCTAQDRPEAAYSSFVPCHIFNVNTSILFKCFCRIMILNVLRCIDILYLRHDTAETNKAQFDNYIGAGFGVEGVTLIACSSGY